MAAVGAAALGQSVRGAAITLRGLCKTYGAVVAARDVSLTVGAGEFFTLLGPSGSGKTTTLQIIAGFVLPTRGELEIDGRPVAGLPPQKRDLGFVFQNYALFPHLTVFENVAFPLRVRRLRGTEIRERVRRALALVRLDGFEERLPRHLSGGQQQRVAVARALVFEPRVLLMDEPLGALDKKLREQMQSELKQLQRRIGVTVVYVTHDQEEALTMSDRVAVMRDGAIEQVGTPHELYDAPGTRFVADFLGESNFIEGSAGAVGRGGVVSAVVRQGGQLTGVAPVALASGAPVVGAIRPERIVLADEGSEDCTATGVIEEIVYVGDATRCRVQTSTFGTLIIKEQNHPQRKPRRTGEAVALHWQPGDVWIFPA